MTGVTALPLQHPSLATAGPGIDPIRLSAVAGLAAELLGTERSAAGAASGAPHDPTRIEDLRSADFQAALARGEFSLAYQPIVSAGTGAITGCEALLRWHHPSLGPVSPAVFVPLAERTGAIVPIGAWVLESACRQAAEWPETCRVSVNVSPLQLEEPGFTAKVCAALHASGLPAHRLELELTEGVPMGDTTGALDSLGEIRARGVSVALDDFGTGFSSLGYLQRFAFDRIKIDRSFIRSLDEARESWFLVRTMHDIAHHFGMTVTAEGIESEDEARTLREIGSTELQGFLFGRPMASAAVTSLLLGAAPPPRRSEAAQPPKSLSHAVP